MQKKYGRALALPIFEITGDKEMSIKKAKKSDDFLFYVPRKKHNTW